MHVTQERPEWATGDIDVDVPSVARVYDYFLGGAHNFAVDRALAEQIARMTPDVGEAMRANRAFLRRAVRFLAGSGIRQFLDIGSGIPTVGNVHQVAQQASPAARVVYVDIDPIAVAHSRSILAGNRRAAVVQADARDPGAILAAPELRTLLDLGQPTAILLAGILHFVSDAEDPPGIVARLYEAVVPGSYVAISNATSEGQPPEVIEAQRLSARTGSEIVLRSKEQLLEQFGKFMLIEPGLVPLPLWRPDSPSDTGEGNVASAALGGVARKA